MKKLLLMIILQVFVAKFAFAQRGTGNNSDWKVPVPMISPQIEGAISVNQIAVPNIPAISAPPLSLALSISPQNLVPSVPNIPLVPPLPVNGLVAGPPSVELKRKLPSLQILPPLPAIPSSPPIKMPAI